MSRKYRFVDGEERPVWASRARLRAMGAAEGRAAFREGRPPIRMGNTTYDEAAARAYEAASHDKP